MCLPCGSSSPKIPHKYPTIEIGKVNPHTLQCFDQSSFLAIVGKRIKMGDSSLAYKVPTSDPLRIYQIWYPNNIIDGNTLRKLKNNVDGGHMVHRIFAVMCAFQTYIVIERDYL